jgi:hypothetical protein
MCICNIDAVVFVLYCKLYKFVQKKIDYLFIHKFLLIFKKTQFFYFRSKKNSSFSHENISSPKFAIYWEVRYEARLGTSLHSTNAKET